MVRASQLASHAVIFALSLPLAAMFIALPGCGGRTRAQSPVAPPPPVVVDEEPEDVPPSPQAPPPPPGSWDFAHAKRALTALYVERGPRLDVYCGCPFHPAPGHGFVVDLAACGYVVQKDALRASRIEWEHAVPASVFGRTFTAWTEGDPRCAARNGKRFRGRACARRVSPEFSRIEGDMHNLFPVVGEVNAVRSDLPMGRTSSDGGGRGAGVTARFGACGTSIEDGALSPRPEVRGDLARAYKYMSITYPGRVPIDSEHRVVFDAWDAADPPDEWERERSRRIASLQGAANPFVERAQPASRATNQTTPTTATPAESTSRTR